MNRTNTKETLKTEFLPKALGVSSNVKTFSFLSIFVLVLSICMLAH